jgi:enterochelin esterase-like enzyme
VFYNLYSGGHTFAAWREELAPALRWLLGGAAPSR